MYLKRFLYLGYYFKEVDRSKLNKFIDHVADEHHISKLSLWKHMISASLKYNISLLEYFLFKFYEISDDQKKTYAGTGFMYEYQKKMNPKSSRKILEDKLIFLKEYAPFIKHNFVSINDIDTDTSQLDMVLGNDSKKVVLKSSTGQCGIGIEVRNASEFTKDSLMNRLQETGNDFVEDYVEQHDELNKLSPSGLNTVRIITQLTANNEVSILGARLRITINSSIDNLAAGNIAAPINLETGIVEDPGVYSDITKKDEVYHPITGVKIVGFKVPLWEESIQMVKEAALLHPENRSIGWDIAITKNGPELIEGNHDWCKLLWQLPVKKGLKHLLKYTKDSD